MPVPTEVVGFSLFFGGILFMLIWGGFYFLGRRIDKQEAKAHIKKKKNG